MPTTLPSSSSDPTAASPEKNRANADVLRREAFGGLYFSRRTGEYSTLNQRMVRLLLLARERSAAELVAGHPELLPGGDLERAVKLARWQRAGFLDSELRCRAQVVRSTPVAGAVSAPMRVGLFLTRACNLRCAHCFVSLGRGRDPAELSTAQLGSLFDEMAEMGALQLVLAGGEPLRRPDLQELLGEIGRCRLDAVLSTNATLVTPERARWLAGVSLRRIAVSLDGPDAESHDAVRGAGSFEAATRGVRRLLDAGAPAVALRVTVTPRILDRIDELGPLADALGVHQLIIKPFRGTGAVGGASRLALNGSQYDRATAEAWPRLREASCAVDIADGRPQRLPEWTRVMPAFSCTGGTVRASVLADGRVVACAAVTSPDDWSLHAHSLRECWREAPSIVAWRRLVGTERCLTCEELETCGGGCRARALAASGSLEHPDPWARCPGEPSPLDLEKS